MTTGDIVAAVLLFAGVAVQIGCVVGVLWFSSVFDRIHYSAAASTIGPVLVGAAAVVSGMSSNASLVELVAAVALLSLLNPFVTHATGRAARRLRIDDIGGTSRPGESP